MPVIPIDTLADPRLAPYRNLKDRELARAGGRFIAEGEYVVRRLLASDFPVESVLLAQRRAEGMAPAIPDDVPVYVVPDDLIHDVIGYKFHSGVIACGVRRPSPTLDTLADAWGERATLVLCREIANTENLGLLIRIAAGFGADAMVLDERSADPFFRQAVRVSMGTVFRLPIVRSCDLLADMDRLRAQWGVQLAATVLAPDAEPIERATRPARFGLVFGNEAQGLDERTMAACDRRVTIPMYHGTDSLNVAIAAGVFLYHFTREAAFAAPCRPV